MPEMPGKKSLVGKAKTVLLFGRGEHAIAVISEVVAYVREQGGGKLLQYPGPVTFSEKTVRHLEEVVLAALKTTLPAMEPHNYSFDISVVNLSAASTHDIGLDITGFSGDCALFLAMLSASLQMEAPSSIVSTGHIAAPSGEIRMVKGLAAKLEAALNNNSVNTFIYPSMDGDSSMELLSPAERECTEDALMQAKQELNIVAVRDIHDLIRAVFTDEQVVLASLRNGFYNSRHSTPEGNTPALKAWRYLSGDNESRFWTVLERQLLAGQSVKSKELLHAMAQSFVHRNSYPKKIGNNLFRLVASLPPETRRFKTKFPLLAVLECIRLSQFAMETDQEDVLLLFRSASGEMPVLLATNTEVRNDKGDNQENSALQLILSEMDPDRLTDLISLPIDSARASYVMDSVTLTSYDEFVDSITSFYIHILRHYRKISEPVDRSTAAKEALELLEGAFSKEGGLKGAWSEARHGTKGGLKFIFDAMTEQLIRQEQEKHINYVIKATMDPLDRGRRKSLIVSLLEHLRPALPPDILSQPVDMFVDHHESIVRIYIRSFAEVKSFLRSL